MPHTKVTQEDIPEDLEDLADQEVAKEAIFTEVDHTKVVAAAQVDSLVKEHPAEVDISVVLMHPVDLDQDINLEVAAMVKEEEGSAKEAVSDKEVNTVPVLQEVKEVALIKVVASKQEDHPPLEVMEDKVKMTNTDV